MTAGCFQQVPGSPAGPILFQPPYPLTWHPELWVLTTGARETWQGAQVLWSEDGDDYDRHPPGEVGPGCVTGTLLDPLPQGGVLTAVHVALDHAGTLTSVDAAAAHRLQSCCYVGDGRGDFELLCPTGMRLVSKGAHGTHVYRLDGLCIRGCYGTEARPHAVGARFGWLEEAQVGRLPLPYRLVAARAQLFLKLVPASPEPETGPDPATIDPLQVRLVGGFADGR